MKIIIEKEINPQDDKYCGECKYLKFNFNTIICKLFFISYTSTYTKLGVENVLISRCKQCVKAQQAYRNIKKLYSF